MANASILHRPKSRIANAAAAEAPSSAPTRVFAMLSHRGRVRHANEDAFGAMPERGAFVVCDGMGGAAAGEVASHLATEAFLSLLSRPLPSQAGHAYANGVSANSLANGAEIPPGHPRARLTQAIHAANQAVFRHSRKSPSLHGMGTTLVALLFEDASPEPILKPASPGDLHSGIAPRGASRQHRPGLASSTLWLVHVGDSRGYLFRSGTLRLLTQDHSVVEEQVRAGLLSRVDAGRSPIRNIITRAIGSQSTVEPEIDAHVAQSGDLYLLASDGLTRELEDDEIAGILRRTTVVSAKNGSAGSSLQAALDTACQALIDAANLKGGGDNITVLLVACP